MADEEKAAPIAHVTTEGSFSELQSQHLQRRHGRLYKLFHPSGKTYFIVNSRYDIESKREEVLKEEPKPEDFDILIHGSDEHITAVRDCHAYQSESRDAMYANNGDLLDRYETVRTELDALNHELHNLTDHAVSLDASFDKFGYSARIRVHGDSDTSSLHSTESHDASKHQDRTLTAMKFFKAPVVRQYFHKGLLWRSPQSSEVVSFELFVDLVYVAVIDAIGEVAVLEASAASFLHYIIIFAIASKVFNDILTIMNWFEINDVFGRLCVLFIVVCLYSFASNTEYMFETTYTAALSFYLASRFFVATWFCLAATWIPMVRWNMVYHAIVAVIAAVLWIGSIHVEYPRNLPLIFIAIIIDMFGSQVFMPLVRRAAFEGKGFRWLKEVVEYLPAINIEHRVERTGAFISLVIGYSVIKIFFQSHSEMPMNAFLGKGILGLIQAFVFNWIYFEIDAWGVHVHAIRRHWVSTSIWNNAHIPFSAGFILAASTLSELVIAHDSSDADYHDLAEAYASTSLAELDSALRWFYCGGLGVALLSMTAISLCHVHKRFPDAKLSKWYRLSYRVAVAIVIICLPLAGDRLSSLDLIVITTCLVSSVLMVDIFGITCRGDGFFKDAFCPKRRKQTQYTARCQLSERKKREMREAVKRGEKIDLDEILRRDGSVTSLSSSDTQVDLTEEDKGAGSY